MFEIYSYYYIANLIRFSLSYLGPFVYFLSNTFKLFDFTYLLTSGLSNDDYSTSASDAPN
jgi:hypothetical protein